MRTRRRLGIAMDERSLLVLKSGAAAGILKGGSMLIALAMIPAYIQFFGDKASLGTWLVAVSVVNWVLTFDFGIGNGMRNSLVGSLERQDWKSVRREVAGAYGAALALAIAIVSPLLLLLAYSDWVPVGDSRTGGEAADLRGLIAWLIATVACQFVLRTVSFVLYSLQRAAVNNVMALCTSTMLLLFVLIAGALPAGPHIGWLGPAYLIAVNLPLVVTSVWVFASPLRRCLPWRLRDFVREIPVAFRSGRHFFLNQVLYTALLGTSAAMVVAVAGSAAVVNFQAQFTLFSVSGILATLALTPLWSAVTHALVVRDFVWLHQSFRRVQAIGLLVCIIPVITAVTLDPLLQLWLGRGVVQTSPWEAVAFVLFGCGFVLHGVVATFAAGLGKLRLQLKFYGGGFLIKILVVLWCASRTDRWALVPAMDGVILLAYFAAERGAIRRWLAQQESVDATATGRDPKFERSDDTRTRTPTTDNSKEGI